MPGARDGRRTASATTTTDGRAPQGRAPRSSGSAVADALAELGVSVRVLGRGAFALQAGVAEARLTHDDDAAVFVVDRWQGRLGTLIVREHAGVKGRLAALDHEETGDGPFDGRFWLRGDELGRLGFEERRALLSLAPPVFIELGNGRLRMRAPTSGDAATLAYAFVRLWSRVDARGFAGRPAARRSAPRSPTGAAATRSVRGAAWPQSISRATSPSRRLSVEARDILLDAVRAGTRAFAGDVAREGDAVVARCDLAATPAEQARAVVVARPHRKRFSVELRAPSPSPPLSLVPQRGVRGLLASLSEDHLAGAGLEAVDAAFIVRGAADAAWLADVSAALLSLAHAGVRLDVEDGGLVAVAHDVADVLKVAAVVAAMLAVADRAAVC